MELATNYMGLRLRNPLVASPSPLSYTLDGVRRLADGGVGAIVLFSLFEEQLREEAARNAELVDGPAESFAEALDYVPAVMKEDPGPRRYLSLLERAVAAVDVPVIASLNGVTPEGWTDYARAMQDAGAAAIELNIYYLPGDPRISGRDVEQRHVDILNRVKDAVTVPVAVKLSPYFSSIGEIAVRLDEAGADALVLFNRFLQPDVDPEELVVLPRVNLSSPADGRLPRTWIALLRESVQRLTGGHHRGRGARRRRPVPARGRRRGDDHLRAAAPRAAVRERAARRALAAGWRARDSRQSKSCAACCPRRPTPTRRRTSGPATCPRCEPLTRAPTPPGRRWRTSPLIRRATILRLIHAASTTTSIFRQIRTAAAVLPATPFRTDTVTVCHWPREIRDGAP